MKPNLMLMLMLNQITLSCWKLVSWIQPKADQEQYLTLKLTPLNEAFFHVGLTLKLILGPMAFKDCNLLSTFILGSNF